MVKRKNQKLKKIKTKNNKVLLFFIFLHETKRKYLNKIKKKLSIKIVKKEIIKSENKKGYTNENSKHFDFNKLKLQIEIILNNLYKIVKLLSMKLKMRRKKWNL